MATHYSLSTPKGNIVYRDKRWFGSAAVGGGDWAPHTPLQADPPGWQDGDTLMVTCTFDTDPDCTPQPPASEYWGLCVAALCNPTDEQLKKANQDMHLTNHRKGGLFGGITTSSTPSTNDLFYDAKSEKIGTVPLHNGEKIKDLIYRWTMKYNPNSTCDSTKIELVFGYGDPHVDDEPT